jgi:prephenate dehydrogenase
MTVQMTIIGLGQIGSSIGLALKARKVDVHLMGHDKDPQVAREAQKVGAVDEIKYNLPASVRNAKIVILALPLGGIRETLEVIVPDLQEGVLVLETAPAKATVGAWAKELLPEGCFYIGLTPAINPEYLHGTEFGIKAARADLFEKALIAINAPQGTPGNVFELAAELVTLLGSLPLFMDTAEADGIFAATHTLPQLASAALLDVTVDRPGWHDARKLAGRPFAAVTAGLAHHDDVTSLRESAIENRENVVRLLNAYISALIDLRDEIDANDRDALAARLEDSLQGRIRWFDERVAADWSNREAQQIDAPSFGKRVNQILFGSALRDRQRQRR